MPESLFLFAHQDDEFGVFQAIVDELASGRKVFCAFLTDGVQNGVSPEQRNKESISALVNLGVVRENILFVGEELKISDGRLIDDLSKARNWLINWVSKASELSSIYLPAWEGGHPDHDSLHVVGAAVANELNLTKLLWQFPLYNGYKCKGQLFRVLLALPENGPVISKRISWLNRFRFLVLVFHYRSQAVTWVGLMPFVLMHYLFWGTQSLQKVSLSQTQNRPHMGRLYYERRNFCTWRTMSEKVNIFMGRSSPSL